MAHQSALTPVKVRGKRRGIPAEKWNTGKRRKPELRLREAELPYSTPDPAGNTDPPAKRRKIAQLSPLESLPPEVLQEIFECSGNVDLPVVSVELASKLSKSQHLYKELASRLLDPVLGFQQGSAAATDLKAASRLMNSRFFSWNFFTSWLRARGQNLPPSCDDWHVRWSAEHPSPGLLPPLKLLRPPFVDEKVSFLSVFARHVDDIGDADAAYVEVANDGLVAAVKESNSDAAALFLSMGLSRSTELLRLAVESGCDEALVVTLLGSPNADTSEPDEAIDLLDPVLWRWAETARARGDVMQASWLVTLLKGAQRQREQSEQSSI